jgi:SulP family sulfate permease
MLNKITVARWLFSYHREWFGADMVAGLTAAAVVLPKAMAYAIIAGLPIEAGLYTALAAMLVYPLLGSSRPLSVTSTSAIAMLTTVVVATTTEQTGASASAVSATLALLVGAILIGARLLRLGFLANFISLPVLVGFEAGVCIVIIIGQLHSALGVHITSHDTIGILKELPEQLMHIHSLTVVLALIGVATLLALPRWFPRLSAPLVWVVLCIVASAVFGLDALGISTVGAVPAGLPVLALPELELAMQLWPAALGIALMSFTESVAAARAFCQQADPPINANQELLAVGVTNVASSLVSGLPTGGGVSQTKIADAAGARSQMAQWINAAVVLLCLLLLSGVIALLPKAALAALIIVASASMIKPADFRAIAQIHKLEFFWALITLAGVVFIGTLEGILIAVAISILTLFYQVNHPPVYAVAYNRAKNIFRRAGEHADDESVPGILILRTEGRLTFANANRAREKMQSLIAETEAKVLILECSAIPDIEYSALVMLTEAEQNLRARGISLCLATLNPDLLSTIKRSPLGKTLGHQRLFFNLHKALEGWQQSNDQNQQQPPLGLD